MPSIIKAENISLTFDKGTRHETRAVSDVSLEIHEGEFFVFVGQSGSGKSTLLRIFSGLEKSFRGALTGNYSLTEGEVGFVFQQFALLPWLTVYDNVSLGLLSKGFSHHELHAKVTAELTKLGLEKSAQSYPRELSGGMRQRVGIARALVTNPKIIFMDEPFSELDSFTARTLRQELLNIWSERKMTVVMVTHIIEDAVELADRIGILSSHPGMLTEVIHNTLPRPRIMRSKEAFALQDKIEDAIMKHSSIS